MARSISDGRENNYKDGSTKHRGSNKNGSLRKTRAKKSKPLKGWQWKLLLLGFAGMAALPLVIDGIDAVTKFVG